MTATTHVRILTPLPIDQLWAECESLIGAPEDVRVWESTEYSYAYGRRRANETNQGLPALIWVNYAIERPLEEDDDETTDGVPIAKGPGPFFAEVGFDTPYGFEDRHKAFVAELDAWLTDRFGIEAYWRHDWEHANRWGANR